LLQPSPLREISSRDYEGGEVLGNKEQSGGPLLDLGETNVGVITFLISGSGSVYCQRELADRNKFQGGVILDDHNLAKMMNKSFEFPCETTRIRIKDNQYSKECTWSE
jgi:hypothetical protein